ncbi:predicted protein [Histoplasma capsulatum G186AR]|uniref:Uncharacterized protein n=1 Tax=Ajellomyces capsulatus (strain G186AR / H82 / ATCC MYA-2454 / RMSCC 2432) TaxID=447093 RepID=C0NAZ0_AJECG|nr:uncharacterized protein HCBG_00286 [Histoplasma capsulatum G186AR]EEH10831.1 predicted protein [Histoplasma capsulatum G186AR]
MAASLGKLTLMYLSCRLAATESEYRAGSANIKLYIMEIFNAMFVEQTFFMITITVRFSPRLACSSTPVSGSTAALEVEELEAFSARLPNVGCEGIETSQTLCIEPTLVRATGQLLCKEVARTGLRGSPIHG